VDLANEIESLEDKKVAVKGLARCYQECKSYLNAIRCYKKLLEASW
jgi:hypothetical protein